MDINKVVSWFILILYLLIGFVPNWQAVDKIAPQWLVMNLVNIVSILYIAYNRKSLSQSIQNFFNSRITILYLFFIVWAALSYFYAINKIEQIVNISRQFNVFVMFSAMFILLSSIKSKFQFFSWVFTVFLGIEIFYVLLEAQQMISTDGYISPGALKGVTANRNITAFSLAIKLPFVYFLLTQVNKKIYKLLLSVVSFSTFFGLLMIQSRASFLATGFGVISFIGGLLFLEIKKKEKLKLKLQPLILIVISLTAAITINQTVLKDKGADALSRAATIGQITTDDSITARLRYYSDVIDQMISSPIFGVGLGNWKLKSIDYDKYDIKGYVVPYHAHSDFIQLGAELGVIGFFSYLSIFILLVITGFKIFLNRNEPVEKRLFVFLMIVSLGIYSVDSSLNFPIARPQVLIVWTFLLAIIGLNSSETRLELFKKKYYIIYLTFLFLIPTLYINNSVYNSLKGQMFLLQDFNSNQFNVPLNQVDNIVPDMPNITVTTIPINSVKARYYVNAKRYDKAFALLDKGTSANPYLFYSEILKSQIFQEQGKLDSAKVYARKAFFGLPNNDLHASRYINLINLTRDKKALEEAFELLTYKNKENNWKNYLIIANSINSLNDPVLIDRAKKATETFPNNREIKNLYNQIAVGTEKLNESISYSKTALEYFNKGDYQNAAIQFEKALEANSLDYANFENAATANYMIGNLEKAEKQIDVVINDLNPLNGKCEYIKALIYIKMGDPIGACPYLATARDSGFSQADAIFDQYCR